MMVSDEEKRWIVVGIVISKVAAPVLRDFLKQGIDTHYANLDTYCSSLTTPCTLKTLTYHHVNTDPSFKHFKFQNINNNRHLNGKYKNLYNYNINSSVDLAKLFLPEHLAEFSAFDESLDMSAILRLLGYNKPAPIFHSPKPYALISIQTSADDVSENVRNKWGHCNVTDWTEVLFNDCFSKLKTLVRSLGLTGAVENFTLDQLSDWQTKGCQLCMGHAVDKDLLSLVQIEVKGIIADFTLLNVQLSQVQGTVSEHNTRLDTVEKELQEDMETRRKEIDGILERLVSTEKTLGELSRTVQALEEGLAATNVKVEEQGLGLAKIDDKLEQLQEDFAETGDKLEQLKDGISKTETRVEGVQDGLAKANKEVEQLKDGLAKADNKVERLEREVKCQRMKGVNPVVSPLESFDVKTCRMKLADHYKRTATVPTSVWSKKSPVKIHQIYTRLSWVKEEQTPAGSSRSELGHYTDVFTSKDGVVPKRILVQGQTGIGKSTFVKKLAVDWAELDEKMEAKQRRLKDEENSIEDNKETSQNEPLPSEDSDVDTSSDSGENMSRSQDDALKKFEILLVINLKEVFKCQNLQDIINRSHIFSEEETALTEGLLNYISKNQEKILLVLDGYDEYHCGNNSDIYEIFRGNKLRNCYVLITTRISKADDLREFKDVCAEITGFSGEDREAFVSRVLGGKAETKQLLGLLEWKKLTDLARVPILLLFFCTLWKRGKLKSFPDTKTELYLEIIQCVLDYSHGKCSPARFAKVQDCEEILAEIGKVALECLLKGEHVFEYDQLSAAILSEESVIIGLLQVTEDAENQRPAGMVSFFHKSIQEFLAAWYITYRCVPKGSLGETEDHARTLENCQVLENVFQFVCGLSEDGALRVSAHLTSVRISDPSLVLLKTAPDVENETDVIRIPCDITDRQKWFSEFVVNSFREVHSLAEFVRHCFDCTGGFVLASKLLCESAPKAKDLKDLTHSGVFIFAKFRIVDLYDWLLFLVCLHLPLRVTEGSAFFLVEDFLKRFYTAQCKEGPIHETHFMNSILSFCDGQFKFYITDLVLFDDDEARLYTETSAISVPRDSRSLHSEQLCLKFLRSLICVFSPSSKTMKDLGAMIRNCKHLNRVEVNESDDSVYYLLEQIPMPSSCSLQIGHPEISMFKCALTSAGAEALARLLPRFNNITCLYLGLSGCCTAAVDKLVPSITHKTLEELELNEILLTPMAAGALSQTLPKMLSLRRLILRGKHGSSLQANDMDALFGRFNKPLPVEEFSFHSFSVRGCLAPLTNSLRFFPNLRKLSLLELNMDEHDVSGLQESLRLIPNLDTLELSDNPFQNCPVTQIIEYQS